MSLFCNPSLCREEEEEEEDPLTGLRAQLQSGVATTGPQ